MKIIYIILIIIIFIYLSKNVEKFNKSKNINDLRFSNTMKWDKFIINSFMKGNKIILDNNQKKIVNDILKNNIIKNPFPNDSFETNIELNQLMMKKLDRNKRQADIEKEINREHNELKLVKSNKTDLEIINKMLDWIDPFIMYFKHKFDRVRPHFLKEEIKPSIEVPGHPAYPSGHATQAYTSGMVMGFLYPNKKSYFYKLAERIAENREYAGVHYASDSRAGEILATFLLPHIIKFFKLKPRK